MKRRQSNAWVYSLLILMCLSVSLNSAIAAVGCTLNDPDRDIRRIFPQATGFKTEFITIKEKGGASLAAKIENELGDKLDPIYETIDVPYAYYSVLKGKEIIGRVHGVNQKGKYGGIQIIIATDTNAIILDFYYQRISSPEAKKFKNKDFLKRFHTLTLLDFYTYQNLSAKDRKDSKVGKISNPSEKSEIDFKATIRGIMKNLILLDKFLFNEKQYKEFTDKTNKSKDGIK